ncbi:hypothetical protein MRB53_022610 [Persea americana]|uniref:Uncharacterized protein n=1 Tax=Persea americana TaxID=3435 RepID=A0ACC2L7G7_PERAE|nr:hypothetical protein MRB53_022610 [Persea americana]
MARKEKQECLGVALIKTRKADLGWMILYHLVYSYNQLGTCLILLIQLSREECHWILISSFIALPIVEYEIIFLSREIDAVDSISLLPQGLLGISSVITLISIEKRCRNIFEVRTKTDVGILFPY